MIFSRAMLIVGVGVCLMIYAGVQQAAAQNESSFPVDLDSFPDPTIENLQNRTPNAMQVQTGPRTQSLGAIIEDALNDESGIRETKFKLKILADSYFKNTEENRKEIRKKSSDLSKLKLLFEEAQLSGSVERNGKSISLEELKQIADVFVKSHKEQTEKLRRNEVISKKLQAFYSSLNTACENRLEVCKSAESKLYEIRQSVIRSGYDCETAYLNAKRYMEEGIKFESGSQSVSTDTAVDTRGANGVEARANSNSEIGSVVKELTQLADKLESQGQVEEAKSLRRQASRLSHSK